MTQRSRTALKAFFETGDKPTQTQYSDLIDSFINQIDDVQVGNYIIAKLTGFDLNIIADQKITLPSGTFIISDVIITNLSGSLNAAYDLSIYDQVNRGGTRIVTSVNVADQLSNLDDASHFISFQTMDSSTNFVTVSGSLYASMFDINALPLTCDIYVIGFKLQ